MKAINAGAGISITETANGIWSIASNTASSSTRAFRYFNNGSFVPKATFNLGTAIDLRTNRVRGVIRAQLQPGDGASTFHFPILDFNNQHTYPTATAFNTGISNEMNWIMEVSNGQAANPVVENEGYGFRNYKYGRNINIAQIPVVGTSVAIQPPTWFVTNFDITLLYNNGFGNNSGLSCQGLYTYISKETNLDARQYLTGMYNRHSELGGSFNLTHIGFGSFTNFGNNRGMQYCECSIEIIPHNPLTVQSSIGPV